MATLTTMQEEQQQQQQVYKLGHWYPNKPPLGQQQGVSHRGSIFILFCRTLPFLHEMLTPVVSSGIRANQT
jgi:hypothetical protein